MPLEFNRSVSVRLGASGLSKSYGPVEANKNISLEVRPGEIHAIVGENGAGKSTLMRLLQGIEQPDSGYIVVNDEPVRFSGSREAFAAGVGMIHQEFMLAPDLTLLENLVLGDEPVSGALGRIVWSDARVSGDRLAGQAGVDVDWDRKAGTTPVHIQQFVEIIRLLRRGTQVLIMDEPTAVLAPRQVEDLFHLLNKLRDNGATIIFISHKLNEVMALADRITVIRRGEVVFSSATMDTGIEDLSSHVIGEKLETAQTGRDSTQDARRPVLEVKGLSAPAIDRSHPIHEITMTITAGEIVGLAGVSGNGQSELVECLVGLRHASSGSIVLDGLDITHATNRARRNRGMRYVSSDRRNEGLAHDAAIDLNTVAGSLRKQPILKGRTNSLTALRDVARRRLEKLNVRYGRLRDAARSLSGGNQQRVVFAREISNNPTLLVVSQPTRGVDLKGIAAIHSLLMALRGEGKSVLLISEELDEIIGLSDRVYVIADGGIAGEMAREEMDVSGLGRMMLTRAKDNE